VYWLKGMQPGDEKELPQQPAKASDFGKAS